MGADTLRDQLLKARLVSKKQVRRALHEERIRRKELGMVGIEGEKERAQEERETRARQLQEDQRRQAEQRRQEQLDKDTKNRLRELALSASLKETGYGNRRYYFVARDGKIPFLDLSDDLAYRLEKGMAAIVEIPGGPLEGFTVVPRAVAERMKAIDAEVVRFINQEAPST